MEGSVTHALVINECDLGVAWCRAVLLAPMVANDSEEVSSTLEKKLAFNLVDGDCIRRLSCKARLSQLICFMGTNSKGRE